MGTSLGVFVRANRGLGSLVMPVLRTPSLLLEAVRMAAGMRRRKGARVSESYMRWRVATAYGSPDHGIEPADLIAVLRWRRMMRTSARQGSGA